MTTSAACDIRVVPDARTLARAAADLFIECARAAVTARGRFDVALSGGSTPRALYVLLANDQTLRDAVPWSNVHLYWGDERHVAPHHPDSNYRMVREAMLDHIPIPDENVHAMPADLDDADAVAMAYQRELERCFAGLLPRFDLVLLGLGADGHTASLFPNSAGVLETRRWVCANWIEKLAAYRITLTAPVLNAGRLKLFLVAGADKAAAVERVLQGPRDVMLTPAQLIEAGAGQVIWLLDAAAAPVPDGTRSHG